MDGPWRIELLGGLRAIRGETVITRFRTRKTGLLLAYLAYYRDRAHPRSALMELLWPDHRLESARASLSTALSSLRPLFDPNAPPLTEPDKEGPPVSQLSAPVILADHGSVWLNADRAITDVAEFQRLLQTAAIDRPAEGSTRDQKEALTRAIEMYRGELLPDQMEAWVLQERLWLSERYFQALTEMLRLLERAGDLPRALLYARRGLAIDPLREETHRTVMHLHAAAGQPGAALRQYRELEQLLQQEFAAAPDAQTQALAHQLAARAAPGSQLAVPGSELGTWSCEPGAASTASCPKAAAASQAPAFPSGALPVDSPFYVARPADAELYGALDRWESIVRVVGPRQIGKTSMLARGLQHARRQGAKVLLTDFQVLDASDLTSAEHLFPALARWVADLLDLETPPDQMWRPGLGASVNFERFLRRQVLEKSEGPVVWVLDEVDRLLPLDWSSQAFGLFRSWHNRRSLEPEGPWGRLVLALAYAAEAHRFITDVNQSPFNVGFQIMLSDFACEQVADLNRQHGSPLHGSEEVLRFHRLLCGHPYLTNRGLWEMAARNLSIEEFERSAPQPDGLLGDHLEQMRGFLEREPGLEETVRSVLQGLPCPAADSFYTLRSTGILAGDSPREADLRCPLYHAFLARRLL